jgi:carbon-monoxide dehydrogenase large subunit
MVRMTTVPPSAFGRPALRTEDPRFLRGEGRYLENVEIPGASRAVFVRSMFPHAVLNDVGGLDEARAMPGVQAVLTVDDLGLPPMPPSGNVEAPGELELPFHREVLARDRLRFVGEPFALVVAATLPEALDAAEVIVADADALGHVTDPEAAVAEGAPLLWPEFGSNVAHSFSSNWNDDVLAGSDVVVRARFVNQRLAPVPMETNGIAAVPGSDGAWTVYVSTQVPFDVRNDLAEALGVERARVRTIAPDVGGGFGAKLTVYAEYLAVARAAQLLGRPVRWAESRSESMVALTHGRGHVQRVEIGATRDGTLVGLRADLLADMGAYPIGALLPTTTAEMLAGVYRWAGGVASRGRSVVTNATPIAAYRGAGRPEAAALVERAVDMVAVELGIDPADIRRRNLIPADAFPFTTATGRGYDTGDYERSLDEALQLAGYAELREAQRVRRDRGDGIVLGIGVSTYVELTAFQTREFARVTVEPDGSVTVATGVTPNGQGHETAFAQLVGAILAVPIDRVRVVHSDTSLVERGEGTWASRSLQAGGTVAAARAGQVVDRGRDLAAALLEVDPADVEGPVDGGFRVAGAPERAVTWAALAGAAGDEVLEAKGVSRDPGPTFPFGAHVAVVEVDTQTGAVRLVRHVAVDDCGRILNPALVRGQQHGGIAQGVAQALFEEVRYDHDGNPITANLTGYVMPSATELPSFECANTETPTPVNPLGVKGIGESGTIGSTPAVQNAVIDALAHLGVRHVDLPCSPERVWRAIRAARRTGDDAV